MQKRLEVLEIENQRLSEVNKQLEIIRQSNSKELTEKEVAINELEKLAKIFKEKIEALSTENKSLYKYIDNMQV